MSDLNNSEFDFENFNFDNITNNANVKKTDERFWKPEPDKFDSYKFYFLPDMKGELPYIKLVSHELHFTGKKDYGYCNGDFDCPVCKRFFEIIKKDNPNREYDKKMIVRKEEFIANIYIEDDPYHPENNGKVMLYKFSSQIFKLIQERIDSKVAGEKMQKSKSHFAFNVFNPLKTSVFNLKVTDTGMKFSNGKVTPSYATSTFKAEKINELKAITEDKTLLKEILSMCYNLKEYKDSIEIKYTPDYALTNYSMYLNGNVTPTSGSSGSDYNAGDNKVDEIVTYETQPDDDALDELGF